MKKSILLVIGYIASLLISARLMATELSSKNDTQLSNQEISDLAQLRENLVAQIEARREAELFVQGTPTINQLNTQINTIDRVSNGKLPKAALDKLRVGPDKVDPW